jgi:hypothetical protein
MPHHLSLLKNNSKNSSSMPHHLMTRLLSLLKIILKIKENHLMPHHLSPLKNNFENTGSMPSHISPFKNNLKTLEKCILYNYINKK